MPNHNTYKPIRIKQAAEILGISTNTLRNWCDQGRIPYEMSVSGQRVFNEQELIDYKNEKLGVSPPEKKTVFYVRSSSSDDVTMDTQIEKLTQEYGTPHKIYRDKASGLKDNRSGLNSLFSDITSGKHDIGTVAITNKNRLTRFGYRYIERFLEYADVKIVILDSDETKEPYEVLMSDFMSLIASFSGEIYRLRGWEQRKKLLNKAQEEVNKHV